MGYATKLLFSGSQITGDFKQLGGGRNDTNNSQGQFVGLVEVLCQFDLEANEHQVAKAIPPAELVTVGDAINSTIDFEQSKSRHRPSVKIGVDAELDELKRRYDGMGSFLTEVINHINQQLPEWAAQYIRSCIFLPQLGFLTVVELDPETGKGKYEGEGSDDIQWERLFTADGTVCYKNKFMKDLDGTYGDMYCEIGGKFNAPETKSCF